MTDHDSGRVVWAAPGKGADTALAFFDALGAERTAQIETITIDMSNAYKTAIAQAAPHARVVFDGFHVQRLAHDALDKVRRQQWRAASYGDKDAIFHGPWSLIALVFLCCSGGAPGLPCRARTHRRTQPRAR